MNQSRTFPPQAKYPRFEFDDADTIKVTECIDCDGHGHNYSEPFNPSERSRRYTCGRCKGTGEIRENVTGTDEELPEVM